jgi:hypothetical protein
VLLASARILGLRLALPLLLRQGSLPDLMRRLDQAAGRVHPGSGPSFGTPRVAPARPGDRLLPLVSRLTGHVGVGRFGLWRTTCLWRALNGYAQLRAAGDDVRFLIGVRLDDAGELAAHAWLTRAGQPSLLAPAPREDYRVAFAWPPDGAIVAPPGVERVDGIRPSDEAVLTELKDGTGVLLHLGTKHYYTLNRTGVLLWKLVTDGATTSSAALATNIAERFDGADPAAVRADVEALLSELLTEGLLLPPAGPVS